MEFSHIIDTTQHNTTNVDAQLSPQGTSIVIPIYNVEKYLPECIDSAIAQTCKDIEIILVDDGSTDSSGKICDEYVARDSRISVIHKPNGGLSDARNAGLAKASGKYIYFLDSDDYVEPETIELLFSTAEQNNLDMLGFDSKVFTEPGCTNSEDPNYWKSSRSYPDVMSGPALFMTLITNRDYKAPVQLYFYRRDFLSENNLTFKKGIIHEDELFSFTTFLYAERAMHINALLYNRRCRPDSITGKKGTQRNSDSCYIILDEALHKYSHFRDDPKTREAYNIGVMTLAELYVALHYAPMLSIQDSRGKEQFKSVMQELKSLGYDTSKLERYVKLRHLYAIRRNIARHPKLKKFLKACLKFVKRT